MLVAGKDIPHSEATLAPLPVWQGPERPRLRFLGTGTSAGVPILGCQCKVCRSTDPRDRRLRTAALLETREARILIDAGPDIRQQLLPLDFYPLDAILLTHIHYDHVGGLDDLRGFCIYGDQHIYSDHTTAEGVRRAMPYCFTQQLYPGVPLIKLHEIRPHQTFRIRDVEITPIEVIHGKLPILGYRFGRTAYITDMKSIADSEIPYLQDLDTLVLGALRFKKEHHSHMLIDEAISFARRIGAKRTFFVHLTHQVGLHDEAQARLPEGFSLAYDGLEIEL